MYNKKTVVCTILVGGLIGIIVNESYEKGQKDLAHKMMGIIETFNESIKESEQEEA